MIRRVLFPLGGFGAGGNSTTQERLLRLLPLLAWFCLDLVIRFFLFGIVGWVRFGSMDDGRWVFVLNIQWSRLSINDYLDDVRRVKPSIQYY